MNRYSEAEQSTQLGKMEYYLSCFSMSLLGRHFTREQSDKLHAQIKRIDALLEGATERVTKK